MPNRIVHREKITACFTSETDTQGNTWSGIRADATINKHDIYKGISYSQYYLTLPGVPVLCHFFKLENGTGNHVETELTSMLFTSGKEWHPNTIVEMTADDKAKYRLRLSGDGLEMGYDRLISFSREKERRPEKLYVYKDSIRDRGKSEFGYDINIAYCELSIKGSMPNTRSYTTKPILCILTEKDLTLEALTDFSKIDFNRT